MTWRTIVVGCLLLHVGADVRLNQIGYYPNGVKRAVVIDASADTFEIRRESTDAVVFTGSLSSESVWEDSGENSRLADFSGLKDAGDYVLVSGGDVSHPFAIKDKVFLELATATQKAYYFNRCSVALPAQYAGQYNRSAGHPDTAVSFELSGVTDKANDTKASPGGWYDAGDFNKYIVNSGISTYQLLVLYENFPARMADFTVNIPPGPTGGDPLPDLLAECWYNIEWMTTMQDDDGGIFHKLVSNKWAGSVLPAEDDYTNRYFIKKTTNAALNFAAVLAAAYRIFHPLCPDLCTSWLASAEHAYAWAEANPDVPLGDAGKGLAGGDYQSDLLQPSFFWAATEIYYTTGNATWKAKADANDDNVYAIPSWHDVAMLGQYTRVHLGDDAEKAEAKEIILARTQALLEANDASPFRISMRSDIPARSTGEGNATSDYVWGSNGVAGNQAMMLMISYQLTGLEGYLDAAVDLSDYLLGRNGMGQSYVTGFGTVRPMYPHHRQSDADGIEEPVPGFVVGGPNPGGEDISPDSWACTDYLKKDASGDVYSATAYIDHWCSYASNEVTINWNSANVYAWHALEQAFEDLNNNNKDGTSQGSRPHIVNCGVFALLVTATLM